ncbi:MAG: hypothetical protein KF770_23415 [Anaerolineae bacterium]|nr:hypothetical protein [Anaerolineae bacterium]
MNIPMLKDHFGRLGADLQVAVHDGPFNPWSRRWRSRTRVVEPAETRYVLNVVAHGRRQEQFTLDIWPSDVDSLEFVTADVRPDWRHLLLLVKRLDRQQVEVSKDKFLCGHDERHWFIASVPDQQGIAGVADAMEALKPPNVVQSQLRQNVRPKDWHKRRNAGFIRQGEWFFIPEPAFRPFDAGLILRQEPLQRPFGKPHIVDEIIRLGGETVYVSSRHPAGLTERQYQALIQQQPEAKGWNWRVMRRNPTVYARGKVRHPDHKTITLPFWHRVAMAAERSAAAGGRPANVAFLD